VTRIALVGAWPVLVLGAGWRFRPRRLLALPTVDPSAAPRPPWRHRRTALVAVSVLLALLHPVLAPVPTLVVLGLPRYREVQARRRAQATVVEELPDVVDLLVLAAGAGLTAVLAAEAVGSRARGPVGAALAGATRRIALGEPPVAAFAAVPGATPHPDAVRPLARALVTATEEGVPLEPVLRRVAVEARDRRRRAAEEDARRVPVRLLFPLVACTLPAFVVLTVVPLLVVGLDSLDL
jgi:tight adherence protein C